MLRVYLDSNVWSRAFDEQLQAGVKEEAEAFLRILEGAYYQRKYKIVGSAILDDEVEQIEEKEKRLAVKAIAEIFAAEKIDKFSKSLQEEIKALGLKDKDAMHLAFAIGNSDYFITCDDEILNKGEKIEKRYRIKVVNPVEFVREVL